MLRGLKDPYGGSKGDILLQERIREVGPFEDWRARPASALGLPGSVLARRVSAHYADRSDLHARLELARDVADAVQARHILVACGIHRSDSGTLLQISHDPQGVDLGRSPAATARASLALRPAVWIGLQLFESLGHAHRLGAVHGNLSPAAVWIGRDGEPILDFGLAVSPADPVRHDTEPVDLRWVHPEWLEANRFDPRGDVYALTAILWWLIAGQPYRTSPRRGEHRPLGAFVPDVPEGLEHALRDGLGRGEELNPSASELADHLSYVFYRDLDGVDEAAAAELRRWIADAFVSENTPPSVLEGESVIGTFVRAPTQVERGLDLANAPTVATTSHDPVPRTEITAGQTVLSVSADPPASGPTQVPSPPPPESSSAPLVTRASSDASDLPDPTRAAPTPYPSAVTTETRDETPPAWLEPLFFLLGAAAAGAALWILEGTG